MSVTLPRVCVVEPDQDAARELSDLLAQIGHYEIEHVTTLADLMRIADKCDVVVTSLDLPDVGSGVQAIDALCSALSDQAPGVVAVVPDTPDSYSDVYPHIWTRARDCIQAVLSAADLKPDQLARGIEEALTQRRRHIEATYRGHSVRDPSQSTGTTVATHAKLDQILDKLDRLQLEQIAQSARLRKLEEGYAARDREGAELASQVGRIAKRVRKIENIISGEGSRSRRPLVVRLDDLEESRNQHRVWVRAALSQLLPMILGGVVVMVMSYVSSYVQRDMNGGQNPRPAQAMERP